MRKLFLFLCAALMSVGMFAQLATPVISGDEEFTESTTITITCASAGVYISYSLDGSNPGNGYPYTGPITITETTTVKAQAFNEDGDMSAVAEKTFTKKAGASATTVTWNNNDITSSSGYGTSFTKDGVTITAGFIDFNDKNFMDGGTFTTTLGNFTKIEVTAEDVSSISGTGWSGNYAKKTWTGNASSVSFSGDFMGMGMGNTQFVFTIEEPATVAVTGVTLNQNEAQMTVGGETLTLTATVNPNNATDQSVSWSTSDANVATVDNGVVTAVAAGNATITVTTTDGSFTATCAVTVTASAPQPAEPIVVTWNDYDLPSSGSGKSFTKDGVTITCGGIEWEDLDFYGGGTFTTDLGNFTKIEVYAGKVTTPFGEGWSGSNERQTWTGNASSVSFSGEFMSAGEEVNLTFTIEPASTPEPQPAEVTVVFAANNKTVERTVTLPHTFKCSWDNGMDGPDELDIIIHELYNDYYYCNSNMNASGSDQVEVGTEEDPQNDYITIKGVFEGTATVTGDYFDWITGEEGAHNYSITISIKGDEPKPTAVENVQTNQVQAIKFFRDGQLLIEKNGKIYNVMGAQVR